MKLWAGLFGCSTLAALSALCPATAHAQTFPAKTIRVVTTEPGSSADFVARQLAQVLSSTLGHSVIVDNRGGGGGAVAAELVARATPDGHTLLFYGQGIWILPLMRENLRYDPVKDFSTVTLADRSLNV